jgi:ParB family chromosome partitioning protein
MNKMTTPKRSGLGKGLTALLQNTNTDITGKNPVPVNAIAEIKISDIEANPFQPRLEFDEAALEELAESIRIHGIIQPITVRKVGNDKYELISGERRTRASIRAGLKTIPAYVRLANDQSMLEMALIENIHRENLNPIEVALSYQRLIEECRLKQEELAERVSKSRSAVTNYLRLLKLPEEIQIALRDSQITIGHARPLIGLDSKELQLEILDEIIDHELTVRKVEEMVKKKLEAPKPKKGAKASPKLPSVDVWQSKLSQLWPGKVKIRVKNNGKGELVIPIGSEEDLKRIASALEKQ